MKGYPVYKCVECCAYIEGNDEVEDPERTRHCICFPCAKVSGVGPLLNRLREAGDA